MAQPTPGLEQAAAVVSSIAEAAKKAQTNKDGLKGLAEDALELMGDINRHYTELRQSRVDAPIPDDFPELIATLVNSLKSVQKFVGEAASRNMFTASLHADSDVRKIKEHRLTLGNKKDFFKMIFNQYIKEALGKVNPAHVAGIQVSG